MFGNRFSRYGFWKGAGAFILVISLAACAGTFPVKESTERAHKYAVVVMTQHNFYIRTNGTTSFQSSTWKFPEPNWTLGQRMTTRLLSKMEKEGGGGIAVPADIAQRVSAASKSFWTAAPDISADLAQSISSATKADRLLFVKVKWPAPDTPFFPADYQKAGAIRTQNSNFGTRNAYTQIRAEVFKYDLPSGKYVHFADFVQKGPDEATPWFSHQREVNSSAQQHIMREIENLSDDCVDAILAHFNLKKSA